jgi:GGDEF domain-containing protein
MAAAAMTQGKSMTYTGARILATGVGLVILGIIVALLYARHVETAEVVAVLLFIPIFFALLRWDVVGGAVAAVIASAVYVAMRWSAIEQVGLGLFADTLSSRALGFLAFGLIGGWANKQLRTSIDKLDLYDQIDDTTGLFNARFLLQETDLEQARAKRYDSVFAVSVVEIPVAWFDALPRKKRDKTLRDVGAVLTASVRSVDRAAHVVSGASHWFAVVLPETGPEGARTFSGKLVDQLTTWLESHDVRGAGEVTTRTIAFPEDEAGLTTLRASIDEIDKAEHPASR